MVFVALTVVNCSSSDDDNGATKSPEELIYGKWQLFGEYINEYKKVEGCRSNITYVFKKNNTLSFYNYEKNSTGECVLNEKRSAMNVGFVFNKGALKKDKRTYTACVDSNKNAIEFIDDNTMKVYCDTVADGPYYIYKRVN